MYHQIQRHPLNRLHAIAYITDSNVSSVYCLPSPSIFIVTSPFSHCERLSILNIFIYLLVNDLIVVTSGIKHMVYTSGQWCKCKPRARKGQSISWLSKYEKHLVVIWRALFVRTHIKTWIISLSHSLNLNYLY